MCEKFSAYKTAARIDIHYELQAVPFAELSKMQPGEPSAAIRERVIAATSPRPLGYRNIDRGDWAERGI